MKTLAPRSARISLTIAMALAGLPGAVSAQGTKADYERADHLRERTQGKVFRAQVRPHWFANGDRFWYRNDGPDGTRVFVVDAPKGTRRPAFDHARLAEALGRALGTPQKPSRLPVANIAFRQEGTVDVLVDTKTWRFNEADGSLKPTDALAPDIALPIFNPRRGQGQGRPSGWSSRGDLSPDKKWSAIVSDRERRSRTRKRGSRPR